MTALAIGLLASYLLGAIPATLLVARWLGGIDLREHGSRNLGATNLFRVMGWRYALPAGLFDVAKGLVPVLWLSRWASPAPWAPVVMGLAAVLGHVFSVFVRFRGGKGVATAAGVVLGLAPIPLAVSAAIWAVTVRTTGYVSLGSVAGALSFPFGVWVLQPRDGSTLVAGVLLAGFIVFTHRANLRRLLDGREPRFGHQRPARP